MYYIMSSHLIMLERLYKRHIDNHIYSYFAQGYLNAHICHNAPKIQKSCYLVFVASVLAT